MPRKRKVPACLRGYARRGLIDQQFKREPLPDEVPFFPVWVRAWATESREEAPFHRARRHAHIDEADGDSDA